MLLRRNHEPSGWMTNCGFHLDQQIAENVAAGMSAQEARYAAMQSFGNPTELRDKTCETWSWTWLDLFLRDVLYGIRTLAGRLGLRSLRLSSWRLALARMLRCYGCAFCGDETVAVQSSGPVGETLWRPMLMEHFETQRCRRNLRSWQKGARTFEQIASWRGTT